VLGGKTEARIMLYETLAEATNQFDPDRRIGLGRFGPIYMVHNSGPGGLRTRI